MKTISLPQCLQFQILHCNALRNWICLQNHNQSIIFIFIIVITLMRDNIFSFKSIFSLIHTNENWQYNSFSNLCVVHINLDRGNLRIGSIIMVIDAEFGPIVLWAHFLGTPHGQLAFADRPSKKCQHFGYFSMQTV